MKAGGASLLALEIGNEPDLFMFNTRRPFWWGYHDFHGELAAYVQAVHRAAAGVAVAGPVTYGPTGIAWFRQAVADESQSLALATHHLYPLIRLPVMLWGSPLAPTVDNLLSEDMMVRMADVVDQLVTASQGLPVQISETNSVANSGKVGVSDVFASPLWGTDYLFTLAEHGARGINFHTVWNCATYTPICLRDGAISPQPLYYAMLVFHEATQGEAQVIPVEVKTSVNVKAHAGLGADGKLYVVLVNKTRSEDVKVRLIVNRNSATVMRLLAPSVDSAAGITFGGSPLNSDGSWWPKPGEALNANGGVFELNLPAASAAVVMFD